jgi:hypothetical protein
VLGQIHGLEAGEESFKKRQKVKALAAEASELDAVSLAKAQEAHAKRLEALDIQAKGLSLGSAEEDAKFDPTVLLTMRNEWIKSVTKAMKKAARALKPGDVAYVKLKSSHLIRRRAIVVSFGVSAEACTLVCTVGSKTLEVSTGAPNYDSMSSWHSAFILPGSIADLDEATTLKMYHGVGKMMVVRKPTCSDACVDASLPLVFCDDPVSKPSADDSFEVVPAKGDE